jgi:hypothetical protein
LKTFCRIYLSDYICGGYELPAVCANLTDDALHDIREYYSINQVQHLLPLFIIKACATAICFFSPNPQCFSDIVFGKDSGVDID